MRNYDTVSTREAPKISILPGLVQGKHPLHPSQLKKWEFSPKGDTK